MPAEIVTRSQHTIIITTAEGEVAEARTSSDGRCALMVADARSTTQVILTRTEALTLAAWIEEYFPPPCGSGDQI